MQMKDHKVIVHYYGTISSELAIECLYRVWEDINLLPKNCFAFTPNKSKRRIVVSSEENEKSTVVRIYYEDEAKGNGN